MSLARDGQAIMGAVVGAEFMERWNATTTSFNQPMRLYCEAVCFGDVWARPGLERKQRSMLCMAMLIALNRPHELRAHVIGALNNGCTAEEIQEVLYQAIVYCGLPAAAQGFEIAEEVLRSRGVIVTPESLAGSGKP